MQCRKLEFQGVVYEKEIFKGKHHTFIFSRVVVYLKKMLKSFLANLKNTARTGGAALRLLNSEIARFPSASFKIRLRPTGPLQIALLAVFIIFPESRCHSAEAFAPVRQQNMPDRVLRASYSGYSEGINDNKPIPQAGISGHWQIMFRNTSSEPLELASISVDGVPGAQLREKFLYTYASLQPPLVAPGEFGTIQLRWRVKPLSGKLQAVFSGGRTLETQLDSQAAKVNFRLESFALTADGRKMILYFKSFSDAVASIEKLYINERLVSASATDAGSARFVEKKFEHALAVVEVDFESVPERGRYLAIRAVADDGQSTFSTVRVAPGFFPIGTYDWPAGLDLPALAAAGANVVTGHHQFDAQTLAKMDQLGMQCLQYTNYRPVPDWQLESPAIQTLITIDEPDVKDYTFWHGKAAKALSQSPPYALQVGWEAQNVVDDAVRIKKKKISLQSSVLVDLTYKPWNWFEYGQTTDLVLSDNYPLTHGESIWDIPTVQAEVMSGAAPHPVWHVYENCWQEQVGRGINRPKTYGEQRAIMHLALGAGARGLIGWWNVSHKENDKRTYHSAWDSPEVWQSQSEVWREASVVAPLLMISHPWSGKVNAGHDIYAQSLLSGGGSMVLSLVNRKLESTSSMSRMVPLHDVRVDVELPSWFRPIKAWQVKPGSLVEVPFELSESTATLKLAGLDFAEMFVFSSDPSLGETLTERASEDSRKLADLLLEHERTRLAIAGRQSALVADLILNRKESAVEGSGLTPGPRGQFTFKGVNPVRPLTTLEWYQAEKAPEPQRVGVRWPLGLLQPGNWTLAFFASAWGPKLVPELQDEQGKAPGSESMRMVSVENNGDLWLVHIEVKQPWNGFLQVSQEAVSAERGGRASLQAWRVPLSADELVKNFSLPTEMPSKAK